MKQLVNKINRYLKLYFRFFKISVMEIAMYRLNSLFFGLASIVWLATTLLFISVIFKGRTEIAGWTVWEVTLLLGIHEIVFLFAWVFFVDNLKNFMYSVRIGSFDKTLLKPVNHRFLVSFGKLDFSSISDVFSLIIIFFVAFSHLTIKVDFWQGFIFFVSILSSFVIAYFLYFIISSLCLFITSAENYTDWLIEATDFDHYPAEIYGNKLKFFYYSVLPILYFAYVPTAILLNKLPTYYVLFGLILILVLYFISKIIWKAGLKNYQSVSS